MPIYTKSNSTLAQELSQKLEDPKMSVDNQKISAFRAGPEDGKVVMECETGESIAEGFLVHRPLTKLDRTFTNQFGLEYGPMGEIKVSPPFN